MSFTVIFGIIKETFVVGAIAFIAWFVWNARGNSDNVSQLKTDLKSIQQNAAQQMKWQQGVTNGLQTASDERTALNTAIAGVSNRPIIVQQPTGKGQPVPATAGGSPAQPPNPGGVPQGQQPTLQPVDIRPVWDAYIAKYGDALIQGAQCYESWPQ